MLKLALQHPSDARNLTSPMPLPDAKTLVGRPPIELSLDEQSMLKEFLGKDQAQARAMFRETDDAGDFMWMAEGGLRYYLPPALEHLEGDESAGGWFVYSLLCSLSVQTGQCLSDDVRDIVKQIADYVDANRPKFSLGSEEDDELLDSYLIKIRGPK